MAFPGFTWPHLGIHGVLWFNMAFHGFCLLYIMFMALHGITWPFMAVPGFSCIFIAVHEKSWFNMDFHGIL